METKIDETKIKLFKIKEQLRAEENNYTDPISLRKEITNLHLALHRVINIMVDVLDEVQNGKT